MVEIWFFRFLPPYSKTPSPVSPPNASPQSANDAASRASNHGWFAVQPLLVTTILALTLFFSTGIEFREKIPIKKSFETFPLALGEWQGTRQQLSPSIIDSLDVSDYAVIDFSDQAGQTVNFYVAYYESQRKGESIHSPATCIPGSGWEFKNMGLKKIITDGPHHTHLPVREAIIQKSNFKQLVFYWFPQRDRILTNPFQLKIYNFWDALTRQRTDGALVRLITPIGSNENLKDAEGRLTLFAQQLVPVLDEFIPQ